MCVAILLYPSRFVASHDSNVMKGGNECYIITVTWLNTWLAYAKGIMICNKIISLNHGIGESKEIPPKIDNSSLVERSDKYQVRSNLVVKVDFRPISKDVWEYYFKKYGGGPIIVFYGRF